MFGGPESGGKLIDGAIAGLDKAFFTREERAEQSQMLADWYLRYLEATQPQNIARRFIALLVTYLWVGTCLVALVQLIWWRDKFDMTLQFMSEVVNVPFGIIIGFYFLTHTVRAYRKDQADV